MSKGNGTNVIKAPVITYTFCSWATMMQHTNLSLILFRAIFNMGYQHGSLQLQLFHSLVHQIFLSMTEIQESIEMFLVMIQFIVVEQRIRSSTYNYRGAYQLEIGIHGEIRYISLVWFCSMMYLKHLFLSCQDDQGDLCLYVLYCSNLCYD